MLFNIYPFYVKIPPKKPLPSHPQITLAGVYKAHKCVANHFTLFFWSQNRGVVVENEISLLADFEATDG